MFGNFLYFIIVLLIYSTYPSSQETNFGGLETLFLFLGLTVIFAYFTWIQFSKLVDRISQDRFYRLDNKFDVLLTRQSIMAVVLFAVDIYGLDLTSFFSNIPLFTVIPTIQALLFLGLFVLYLSIVWACAYEAQQRLYPTSLSRQSYILSNISFSIPILLPWLVLSGLSDIINALPFEQPQRFLSTTEGEVLYFLVFLFGIAIIGPAIIQKFWKCTPLENGFNRNRIENLCKTAGMEYANILYWPIFGGRMITAGVMGLIKKFRYILVTSALFRYLEPEEIDAVIAHEIGHIKKKHLLFYLFFFLGYMLLSYATLDLIIYAILYAEPIYRIISAAGFNQAAVTSTIFSLVTIIIFFIYFRYIFGYFMRNFERQADNYVYTLFESGKPLISTLEKIAITSGQPPDKPNWHHFSINERIDHLKKCEQDKTWITRHDRTLRKSIAFYLVGMIIIGGIGYTVNFGETGKKLNSHFFEKAIERAIERTPENPNLYSALGDLYYSRKNYEKTIDAYTESLNLNPNNPQVLNNLAWLYATCEDDGYRDSEQAVYLAEKAAGLIKEPHILDTLAESYYVNGQLDKAVAAGTHALYLAKKNRSYYRDQLDKFEKAKKKPGPLFSY